MTYRSIWITAAILHLLHSSGVVGQTHSGLFLSLRGTPIDDDGFVNVSDIGNNNDVDALLCLTNATNCCAGSNRMGEWHLPNGTVVGSFGDNGGNINNDFFSKNRGQSVVRLNRYNNPSERGRFSCELLGDTIYFNILNIGPVSISPSTPVTVTAGETVNLQCSVDITPHSLPAGTSTPVFEWFFGQTFDSPLTSTTINSGSTYSSTLQLTSVSVSDGGMYTCRLRGNHRTAVSTTVTVEPAPPTTAPPTPMVSVFITTSGTNTAGASYSLVCSVTVTGSTDTPTITWLDPMNSQVPSEMVSTTGSMSTLTFNPLSASHAGTYTCIATLTSGEMDTDTVMITVRGPTITVRVDASSATPMAGSMYSLTCTVTGAEGLTGSTITYQWFKDGVMVSGQTMATFSFTPLSFSDAGGYTCQATVTSNLLSGPITTTRSNSVNVTFTLPTLTVSIATGIITVGTTATLTCTVVLDSSVDVPVTVNTVWTGPDNFNRNIMAQQMGSTTTYTSTVMVSSFGRDQSGDYTCTATVSSSSPFIMDSMSSSSTRRVTVGVYLSLKGVVRPNNTAILIDEIGETDANSNNGLQCVTDRTPCCRFQEGQQGEWFFPDGAVVPLQSAATTFYRNRGDDGTVNLNRLNNAVMMPTGRYCCVVPDATGVNQIVCAIIIPTPVAAVTSNPTGIITVGNSVTLTCTVELSPSVDVPVTVNTVWTGPAGFMTTNTAQPVMGSTTTYISTAIVNSLGRDKSGDYTCTAIVNSNAIAFSSIRVIVGSPPPVNVVASQASPSDPVEVSWSPPSGGAITGYTIFYGNGANLTLPLAATSIGLTLNGDYVGQTVSVCNEAEQLPSHDQCTNTTVTDTDLCQERCTTALPMGTKSTCSVEIGIAVGVILFVLLLLVTVISTVTMVFCWRRRNKYSPKHQDDFAVSSNLAYGEVKLEAMKGDVYEDPDKVVRSVQSDYEVTEYPWPDSQRGPAAPLYETAEVVT